MSSYSHRAYLAASLAQRRVGQTLNDTWHLDSLLGFGRDSAVYAASRRDGALAAIKLFHSGVALALPSSLWSALALIDTLEHPGAVRFRDAGASADGCSYLVMELLRGETLLAYTQHAGVRLDQAQAIDIISRLLDVLAAAHSIGVVHRALTMNSVFLTQRGELKLLDLGLAGLFESAAPGFAARTSYARGSGSLAPPELALGLLDEVNAQSDVWASAQSCSNCSLARQFADKPSQNPRISAELHARPSSPRCCPMPRRSFACSSIARCP